jgi:D-alanine-D-alanine ligase
MQKTNIKQSGKVAVLMGGLSAEREISLMSGEAVMDALLRQGVDAYAVDVGEDIIDQLQKGKFDRAFNILHGRGGEDGVMQAVLETMRIPYTGSGVAASSLAMDKVVSNLIFDDLKLPILPFMIIRNEKDLIRVKEKFKGKTVCVKPVHEGSSNGVSMVNDFAQLAQAYKFARQYHDKVMVEPWIFGREFTVTIVENKALPAIEICAKSGFYDYQAKYFSDSTKYICPCDITKEEEKTLAELAQKAFAALGCENWGRVDFLQDKSGRFSITEVNTIPGMTSHSLVPMAAHAVGIEFDELVLRILRFN